MTLLELLTEIENRLGSDQILKLETEIIQARKRLVKEHNMWPSKKYSKSVRHRALERINGGPFPAKDL